MEVLVNTVFFAAFIMVPVLIAVAAVRFGRRIGLDDRYDPGEDDQGLYR